MTASKVVDLYEEMLHERAARGIRPVLYVSSHKDLECSVLVLLRKGPEVVRFSGGRWPAATGFGRRAM